MPELGVRINLPASTSAGHDAFTDIKKNLIIIENNLDIVLRAIPFAVDDGLPASLAEAARTHLKELKALSLCPDEK